MSEIDDILSEYGTKLEHMCRLDFKDAAKHCVQTCVFCTISKSSRNLETLEEMIKGGMRAVRLNFSHETHADHRESVELVRRAIERVSKELGYEQHVCIALDTKGPEIRTGLIEGNNEIELKKGDSIRLSINKDLVDKGNKECVFVDYPNIIYVAEPGNVVFLNDGAIELVVREVAVDCLICQIEVGGPLGSHKGVCLPGIDIDLPPVSEKDRFDLKFGLDNNVDLVFASKIRNAKAISEIRKVLGPKGRDIKIIAKIENLQGLHNLDEILSCSDGILIARSDLAVEMAMDKVMLVQKALLSRCNKVGKPGLVATNLLESMRLNDHPTQSEVCDLANIVLDGADAIMLSSETAIGPYPLQTLLAAVRTCREAETALWQRNLFNDLLARNPAMIDAAHAVAIAAVDASRKALAKAIVVVTVSGRSAFLISKYKPRCPILAVTRCPKTASQAAIFRGVFPILFRDPPHEDWLHDIDQRVQLALTNAKKMNMVKMGDCIIILSPWKDGPGFTNNLRIVYAFYEKESFDCILKKESLSAQKLLRYTIE